MVETKLAVRKINTIIFVQTNSQIRTLIKQLLANIDFKGNCLKFYIFTNCMLFFFKYIWNFLDQLFLLYEFHGSSIRGILFFQFCQLWAVNTASIFKKFVFLKKTSFNKKKKGNRNLYFIHQVYREKTIPHLACIILDKWQSLVWIVLF